MKYTSQDLLLAAEVLTIAKSLSQTAQREAERSDPIWKARVQAILDSKEKSLDMPINEAWREKHPITEFIPQALESLASVAAQIDSIRHSS